MLEKEEFEERQKLLKSHFEQKKVEHESADWETRFWSYPHFQNELHSFLCDTSFNPGSVVAKVITQLAEKSYFYDYKKYKQFMGMLEELLLLPPCVTESKNEVVKKYLEKDAVMLEWGSGYSTLDFAKNVKHVYTIEHDAYWYSLVKILTGVLQIENVSVLGIPPEAPDGDHEEKFTTYINAPEIIKQRDRCEKFDVVLIDGRARDSCLENVISYLHDESIVMIDDFNRDHPAGIKKRYESILDAYEVVEKSESDSGLMVVRKKR